jgi:hypothetical protein
MHRTERQTAVGARPSEAANVIEGTAEPVALPAPEAQSYSRAQAPAQPNRLRIEPDGAGRGFCGLIILDDMATLPQGDGRAWPAFAGGAIGGECNLLGRCLCAHHHERACRRASWTGDRSLVDEGDSPSARTAVCDDQNLVLVTLASARCRLAVGAHDPQRAFATCCSRSARRSRRTLRALRPRWSRWARRPCRTGFALFPRRPGRAGLPLWALSAASYTNGKRNHSRDTFHMHAHTFAQTPHYSFTSGTNSP